MVGENCWCFHDCSWKEGAQDSKAICGPASCCVRQLPVAPGSFVGAGCQGMQDCFGCGLSEAPGLLTEWSTRGH